MKIEKKLGYSVVNSVVHTVAIHVGHQPTVTLCSTYAYSYITINTAWHRESFFLAFYPMGFIGPNSVLCCTQQPLNEQEGDFAQFICDKRSEWWVESNIILIVLQLRPLLRPATQARPHYCEMLKRLQVCPSKANNLIVYFAMANLYVTAHIEPIYLTAFEGEKWPAYKGVFSAFPIRCLAFYITRGNNHLNKKAICMTHSEQICTQNYDLLFNGCWTTMT